MATGSLFRSLLGPAFDGLAAPVRRIHAGPYPATFTGLCRVERGHSALAGVLASLARLPPPGDAVPLAVTITAAPGGGETWRRSFDGHAMTSRLSARDGLLVERLGASALRFRLHPRDGGLDWELAGISGAGVPLPLRWFRGVVARERGDAGRYTFEVAADAPFAGQLVRYTGSLA